MNISIEKQYPLQGITVTLLEDVHGLSSSIVMVYPTHAEEEEEAEEAEEDEAEEEEVSAV